MAKATREAYVEKVTELAKANKVKVMTVPWQLGAPKPSEWERIRNLSKEDKKKHKAILHRRTKEKVPFLNYPCNVTSKGLGWCQLWFLEPSVKLEYVIFGFNHIATDVKVTSLRTDGKVQVWARSEEYDPENRCMKLQPEDEGYPFFLTVDKVKAIIKANRKNWLEYNIAMLKFQEKEEQKLAKKRLGPQDRCANALLRMRQGPAVPAPQTGRTARKRLNFPRKASTTPQMRKKPRSTSNKSRSTGPKRQGIKVAGCANTPAVKQQIRDCHLLQKKLMTQNREYAHLEFLFTGKKSWNANLHDNPHQLLQQIFEVFKVRGNVDLLYQCCMRLINQCDDEIKYQEAQHWRSTAKEMVRKQLSANCNLLNKLAAEIKDLEFTTKGYTLAAEINKGPKPKPSNKAKAKVRVDVAENKGPKPKPSNKAKAKVRVDVAENKGTKPKPSNEEGIIDLASPDKAEAVGEKRADAKAANVKGPEQPAEDKGPKERVEAASTQPDFTQADKDFEGTRHIPNTQTARRHFRKCYPHGYPSDDNFVRHPHYVPSARLSVSGYRSVGLTHASRDKAWRVKIDGHTVGRYHTKAEACEVAYWQHRQAMQMKEFANQELPSAMFEHMEEIGPVHRL